MNPIDAPAGSIWICITSLDTSEFFVVHGSKTRFQKHTNKYFREYTNLLTGYLGKFWDESEYNLLSERLL